jgi:hypothetical protein
LNHQSGTISGVAGVYNRFHGDFVTPRIEESNFGLLVNGCESGVYVGKIVACRIALKI